VVRIRVVDAAAREHVHVAAETKRSVAARQEHGEPVTTGPEEDEGCRGPGLDDLAASASLRPIHPFRPADVAGDRFVGHASSIR
jgi:hypothetical protein